MKTTYFQTPDCDIQIEGGHRAHRIPTALRAASDAPRDSLLYAARKRLPVRVLSLLRCDLLTHWLGALPRTTPPFTRGGLQNVHISGGPTRGRFIAWTDKPHDDTARFCFELEWKMYPHAPEEVRGNALTNAFHSLSALRDELNAVGVRLNITSESCPR